MTTFEKGVTNYFHKAARGDGAGFICGGFSSVDGKMATLREKYSCTLALRMLKLIFANVS